MTNENVLDLRGLLAEQETLTIIDVQGREWKIAADLPLRTALVLLQHAQAWESGQMTAETFDATVDGMHAILKRCNPEVTRDEVLDGFSVQDMIAAISFLSLRLRGQAERSNGAAPTQEQDTALATPKRKRLPDASAVENYGKTSPPGHTRPH